MNAEPDTYIVPPSYYERRLAEKMEDPEFAAAYKEELEHQLWWGSLSRSERRAKVRQVQRTNGYRQSNRPFRRAFGRGDRWRRILLACAEAKIKETS